MQKIFFLSASILGSLAVGFGAFGAHALNKLLEETGRLATFETAVKYHFYHTLLLLIIGLLMYKFQDNFLTYAGVSAIIGIIIFSGSLYTLCLTGITKLGMVTPIGGLFLIASWTLLGLAIFRSTN